MALTRWSFSYSCLLVSFVISSVSLGHLKPVLNSGLETDLWLFGIFGLLQLELQPIRKWFIKPHRGSTVGGPGFLKVEPVTSAFGCTVTRLR